jgi:glycosyltransferase involved in cell wall biosynthesis
MLAPPWLTVPPRGYGGVEQVVDLLTRGLVARDHEVTLIAPPGSVTPAALVSPLAKPQPDHITASHFEADHVAQAFAAIDDAASAGEPFDVVHDHCGAVGLSFADHVTAPVVHTVHGPFDDELGPLYDHHGDKATLVAISETQRAQAPRRLQGAMAVIPNPLDAERWPFSAQKSGELLWMARMAPYKGASVAIAAARRAGRRLVLAGPVQNGQEEYFEREVRPHIDDDQIRYIGTVGGDERLELLAHSAALLMPIDWDEPFGLAMIEALVTGTPVIAFPRGSVAEVVLDGENGFIVADEEEMAAATDRLAELDPERCRASVVERYDLPIVVGAYEQVYRRAGRRA